MKRLFWLLFPDGPYKRGKCGGYWTGYATSLPMSDVWQQTKDAPPDRFPLQMGGQTREFHGPIQINLHA